MRVLFVGLGGIGQRHLRNMRALLGTGVDVMAYRVRRNSPTLTDKLQVDVGVDLEAKYGVEVFSDLECALGRRPDAVFVCNPTALHVPVALAAAQADCNLFIEKPLSHDWTGVPELLQVVDTKGLVAMVGYQLRYHPCLRLIRELLDQKAVGRIVAARVEVGEYLPGWHSYEDYRTMYASRADLGGGVILSQIHELDYVYWLFGLPMRVFALGGHLSTLDIDVEDVASILMDCEVDGRTVPIHVHQDYVQRPPSRTCQIVGDSGKIVADLNALTVTHFGSQGDVVASASFAGFERNQLFLQEMGHFLACLQRQESLDVTIRDAAHSLRMALAAKESLATGQVVDMRGFLT